MLSNREVMEMHREKVPADQEPERAPLHERLQIGILLALVGGFLDIYTYLVRGNVFANAQTGNMVLMSVKASQGDWRGAVYYFIPIAAFAFGVLVTEFLKRRKSLHLQRCVLLLEACILAAVGLCPLSTPHVLVNTAVSFVCSLQVNSFRRVFGTPYATTMCTGNLRSATEQFYLSCTERDPAAGRKCRRYFGVILCFCIGAAAGAFLSRQFGVRAVWVCSVVLLLAYLLLRREEGPSF